MTNSCRLFEREELVEHFRGENGRLQEGALFAAVLCEVLEDLVEFCLFVLVDVQEESAELVFKVVHAAKVIVAALFVRLEEFLAQVAAFEALVDGLGTEPSGAHGGRDAATCKRVRVMGGVANEGKAVECVILENARDGNRASDNVIDFCTREELVQPFHRDVQDV